MSIEINLSVLVEYTDWQREKWHALLREHGERALKISIGPHGDGRFQTVGEVVRHIFSAEKRYIERLSGKPLTDTSTIPSEDVEGLFQFGEQSRKKFREFLETFPAEKWDIPEEHKILNHSLVLTPRKIVVHVVMHEIRHWAQIATLLRLNGLKVDMQDFLACPALGGEVRTGQANA